MDKPENWCNPDRGEQCSLCTRQVGNLGECYGCGLRKDLRLITLPTVIIPGARDLQTQKYCYSALQFDACRECAANIPRLRSDGCERFQRATEEAERGAIAGSMREMLRSLHLMELRRLRDTLDPEGKYFLFHLKDEEDGLDILSETLALRD